MERSITEKLVEWKDTPGRKSLLLRGARQVGKTTSVLDFGRRFFDGTVHQVDLEKHPDWHSLFDRDLDVKRITSELELLLNTPFRPGHDLLFFDEIQSCPRAIMALRYFYEEMPGLHVIAAGSLLEFAMKDLSFPVGRLQTLYMHPLSFIEFLQTTGKGKLAELLVQPPQALPEAIHRTLLEEVRRYMFVGGMPECVQRYTDSGSIQKAFGVQLELVHAFRQDFAKYAPFSDKQCLNSVLLSVARQAGRQIKYARLAEGFANPTIKRAFFLLSQAQLYRQVTSVNPPIPPFGASASASRFKAVLLDVGLMQQFCNLPMEVEFSKSDLLAIYEGALAEQFVGQEFVAAGQSELFYWSREMKSSTAEVDFILAKKGHAIPVEVKSGPSGRLKSMHLFLKGYPDTPEGYVLSTASYAELPEQRLIFMPLYYAYSLAQPDWDQRASTQPE